MPRAYDSRHTAMRPSITGFKFGLGQASSLLPSVMSTDHLDEKDAS